MNNVTFSGPTLFPRRAARGMITRQAISRAREGDQTEMTAASIVVGTDGSVTADRAVDKAGELAAALKAPVQVVMSYPPVSSTAWLAAAGGMVIDPTPSNEGAKAHAEEVVARATDRLARLGVSAQSHVCAGDPSDALMGVAADTDAQMIVVGNRGMVGARRVLGSVPNRISHHAECCVLIVHTCS